MTGTIIEGKKDAYEIIARENKSGHSIVYSGRSLNRSLTVALKEYHDIICFYRERRIYEVLDEGHENILPALEFIETETDDEYFGWTTNRWGIFPFIPGGTLEELLKPKHQLSLAQTSVVISALCDALGFLHQRSVVYRDLKLENILIQTADNSKARLEALNPGQSLLKLFDFDVSYHPGVAHLEDSRQMNRAGTLEFIAPELWLEKKDADYRVDIYSAGIMLYVLLAGDYPFKANYERDFWEKHLHQPLPDPRELNPEVRPEIVSVMNKAAEKDPNRRYQSVGELKSALEKAVEINLAQPAQI